MPTLGNRSQDPDAGLCTYRVQQYLKYCIEDDWPGEFACCVVQHDISLACSTLLHTEPRP